MPMSPPLVDIVLCGTRERDAWELFVQNAPNATICHHFLWQSVIQSAYGHRPFYLMARDGEHVRGILPLILVSSRLFGRSLTSMPFLDYGGVCTDDAGIANALIERAKLLMREYAVDCVELRQRMPTGDEGSVRRDKVGMVLDLSPGIEALWRGLPTKMRNHVRKAEKSGLKVEVGGGELLPEFYPVFLENMRDLGSPVHHQLFFRRIFEQFGEQVRLFLVRDEGRPIGGVVCFFFRDTVTVPWASSLRRYATKCPNNLLYWAALQYACAQNYARFDFGRSSIDSGTYVFKKQWGAQPIQVYWQLLSKDPEQTSLTFAANESKYKIAVEAWKRLPLPVTKILGPAIRKYLTN